jgi:hypothetical protein
MPWGRLWVPPNFPRWVAHPVPQSLRERAGWRVRGVARRVRSPY